jgi:polyferredoxin
MATLALAVLWRSSPDYRMTVCLVVSAGAIFLAIRSFSGGQFILGLLFLGALGVFTPFQSSQFSRALVPILDMATLALFAASPFLIRKPEPR